LIVVWSCDHRGNLSVIRQYRKKGELTAIVFCPMKVHDAVGAKGKSVDLKMAASLTPSFFVGSDRGTIIYADDVGHCTDVHQLSTPIDVLLFFEEKSRLVIITRSLLLTQYHLSEEGKLSRVMQVKLSVSGDIVERGIKSVTWTSPGILVASTEERMVRFFDLATDDSYNISLHNALGGFIERSDRVSVVAFYPVERYLAVGTAAGILAIWKYVGVVRDLTSTNSISSSSSSSSQDWELIYRLAVGSPIIQLQWYLGSGSLAVVTEEDTLVLSETQMNSGICSDFIVLQRSVNDVLVYHNGPNSDPKSLNTTLQVRGISVSRTCFLVWSGKLVKVFRMESSQSSSSRFEALDSIKSSGIAFAIADSSSIIEEAIFVVEGGNSVKIMNFTGTQKGSVLFSETEGTPLWLDLNGKYLAIVTSKGFVKVLDVNTPAKPKQLGGCGQFTINNDEKRTYEKEKSVSTSSSSPFQVINSSSRADSNVDPKHHQSRVRTIRVNSTGTMIAVLCDRIGGSQGLHYPDTKVYVFDRNRGTTLSYDFQSDQRYPTSLFWDESDDRLLACETVKNRDQSSNNVKKGKSSKSHQLISVDEPIDSPVPDSSESKITSNSEVYTFFVTSEHGILMQDSISNNDVDNESNKSGKHHHVASSSTLTCIGINVPYVYYRRKLSMAGGQGEEIANSELVTVKTLRDFVGITQINDKVKASLLDFSFFLTLGKLDEAYRVVKEINSPLIWENMAQMCVKTKRLDVAEVCLGNMGHARGAAAVRESKKESSLEVSIGVLAIQLGLLDDAARMFREASRYDLLNDLYQSAGLWEKAIEIAEAKDRIHLKSTHYQYAKFLENLGRVDEAIEHFQSSDNARTEVPRMLFHLGKVEELNEYVHHSDDTTLLKWWASYLESIDRLDKAKKYYSKAKDYLSLVRIYCFQGDFQKAVDIITESGDRASAYHFARQMESQEEFQEAIRFYALSGCYNHSIRLARAHNLDSELMRFAVKSTPALMIECAQHFEQKEEYDKAIQLYHRGSDIPRALELCFRIGEDSKHPHAAVAFEMLNTIAVDLGADSSPQTLARCADFLVQHQQYNKAIELYVMAKRYLPAIDMCVSNRVSLNEEMVQLLTPPETTDLLERKEVLKGLAKALKKQGSYTLASKKYTQAGDRVRAIKCLVRSGDTKSVIQFANISRNNEIYTLAANYLQQMNWRENVEIMKAIIQFYTKAKSFVQLAGFYDGCAQVEIDEYRDYEKAVGALNEGVKCLNKDNSRSATEMAKSFEKRIMIIEKFIEAKTAKGNPSLTITVCEALLQDPIVEEAIRIGDCLSLLVETFYKRNNFAEAYHYLKELQERFDPVTAYIDEKVARDIHAQVGIPYSRDEQEHGKKSNRSHDDEEESKGKREVKVVEDEEVEEEIDEVSCIPFFSAMLNYGFQDVEGNYDHKSPSSKYDKRRW
jgi:intraflagellar transport protein 140